ncbi:DNA-directed RNA polymerase subunit delta [Melghirimyces profundicolus]|uniref:Probable DNA-directed RNA polymerase subunit delta n=1 Tax=Melghirimyces profundicolus TaxID=1242148 RepID=A0A2T6C2D0_9BACL|nr:DNA-directed RNA polymerase subunit delta [Melghirimyces profundicolus]PTX62482.1 DNA-directed RNA polymerase subunit delta [Melghirimyces profundicolus]
MPENLAEKREEERVREIPMVDHAHHILKEKGEPMLYRQLMEEVAKRKGFSEEETRRLIAQLYTEINIDGRFICIGKSLWGLKRWYPLEQATDSAVAQNVKDDDSDEDLKEEDLFEEEDLDFDGESDDSEEDDFDESDYEEDGLDEEED